MEFLCSYIFIKAGFDISCLSHSAVVANLPTHPLALHQHPPCPLISSHSWSMGGTGRGSAREQGGVNSPGILTVLLLRTDWIPQQKNCQEQAPGPRVSLDLAGPWLFSSRDSGSPAFCTICYDSSPPSPPLGALLKSSFISSFQSVHL